MDNIIEQRIRFGKAQWHPFIFLFLVDFNDGAQLVLSSFLTPVVQHEWNLTSSQASALTSLFYLGTFIGSLASGRLSDNYGRRFLLLAGSTMQLLSSLIFALAYDFTSISIIRFLYGISFGFTIVLTTSLFAETSPTEYRGKGLLLINFAVSIGKLYAILLAYICLENFHEGNWKLMMILSSLPNIIVLYGCVFVIRQSPRFLVARKRFEEAFQNLEEMIKINHPYEYNTDNLKLTQEQKQGVIQWQRDTFENISQTDTQSIFNETYKKTTILLCVGWFSINFMYFGQLVVLPFIYGKQEKSFWSYGLTIAGQLPSFFISLFFIDRQGFGRKKSLGYFFGLSSLFHLLFILTPATIVSSLSRLFMKECFQMLYPFTTESFSTLNRTFGFGFCAAMGRLGSSLMPYIVLPLLEVNIQLIFLTFAISGISGCIAVFLVPRQPMNRPLDERLIQMSNKDLIQGQGKQKILR